MGIKAFAVSCALALAASSTEVMAKSCPWTCGSISGTSKNCEFCTKCGCDWCPGDNTCHSKYNPFAVCGKFWVKDSEQCSADPLYGPPVIAIPGVAGSMLKFEDVLKHQVDLLWARVTHTSYWVKEAALGKFDPATEEYTSYNNDYYKVFAPKNAFGLYAIDNLNPETPVGAAQYWHKFLSHLQRRAYLPGKDLFGFPYDWRQSNRRPQTMKELLDLVESTYTARRERVTLITHSMGCKVAHSFFAKYPKESAKMVGKWIAIGCPWQGATGKPLQAMVTGYNFDVPEAILDFKTAHALEVGVPSIFELMPDPQFNWKDRPYQAFKIDGRTVYKFVDTDLRSIRHASTEVNRGATVDFDGSPKLVEVDQGAFDYGLESMRIWREQGPPESVQVYNIYGTSLDTGNGVHYESHDHSRFSDFKDDKPSHTVMVDGDGTVPTESLMNAGMNIERNVEFKGGEHLAMVKDPAVWAEIEKMLTEPMKPAPADNTA
eukprot:GFYU01007632.1.p1 GENE.GFYU01007632.1~~GFYU01007632.1.p1  ORF type:complete len:489 (-),score=133.61 GFYU01007632.1:61-1527(-)